MKPIVIIPLLIAALAVSVTAQVPGPEEYETKWLLPGLLDPVVDAESTHNYDARSYRIDLNLPMTDGSMTAHAGIWITSEVPCLDSAVFDFTRLVCDSVKRNGVSQDFYDSYMYLAVHLDPPLAQDDSTLLDIYYHRTASTSNRGFYFYLQGSGNNRNHSVAYSITQPVDSRCWFPCFDQPWDKAEQGCQVNVTVPDSFTACANGVLDSTTSNSDGTRTFWWTHNYAVPPYLINFAASVFTVWSNWAHFGPGDSMEARHYIWPEDSALSAIAFRNVPDMIEFFSEDDRFGRYPFSDEKYGQVSVYPFSFGGMEHQT